MIIDFYQYFMETWTYAIYHDRFKLLQKLNLQIINNNNLMCTNNKNYMKIIIEKIIDNKWKNVR